MPWRHGPRAAVDYGLGPVSATAPERAVSSPMRRRQAEDGPTGELLARRQHSSTANEISRALADHDRGGVGMSPDERRHDRRVRNS